MSSISNTPLLRSQILTSRANNNSGTSQSSTDIELQILVTPPRDSESSHENIQKLQPEPTSYFIEKTYDKNSPFTFEELAPYLLCLCLKNPKKEDFTISKKSIQEIFLGFSEHNKHNEKKISIIKQKALFTAEQTIDLLIKNTTSENKNFFSPHKRVQLGNFISALFIKLEKETLSQEKTYSKFFTPQQHLNINLFGLFQILSKIFPLAKHTQKQEHVQTLLTLLTSLLILYCRRTKLSLFSFHTFEKNLKLRTSQLPKNGQILLDSLEIPQMEDWISPARMLTFNLETITNAENPNTDMYNLYAQMNGCVHREFQYNHSSSFEFLLCSFFTKNLAQIESLHEKTKFLQYLCESILYHDNLFHDISPFIKNQKNSFYAKKYGDIESVLHTLKKIPVNFSEAQEALERKETIIKAIYFDLNNYTNASLHNPINSILKPSNKAAIHTIIENNFEIILNKINNFEEIRDFIQIKFEEDPHNQQYKSNKKDFFNEFKYLGERILTPGKTIHSFKIKDLSPTINFLWLCATNEIYSKKELENIFEYFLNSGFSQIFTKNKYEWINFSENLFQKKSIPNSNKKLFLDVLKFFMNREIINILSIKYESFILLFEHITQHPVYNESLNDVYACFLLNFHSIYTRYKLTSNRNKDIPLNTGNNYVDIINSLIYFMSACPIKLNNMLAHYFFHLSFRKALDQKTTLTFFSQHQNKLEDLIINRNKFLFAPLLEEINDFFFDINCFVYEDTAEMILPPEDGPYCFTENTETLFLNHSKNMVKFIIKLDQFRVNSICENPESTDFLLTIYLDIQQTILENNKLFELRIDQTINLLKKFYTELKKEPELESNLLRNAKFFVDLYGIDNFISLYKKYKDFSDFENILNKLGPECENFGPGGENYAPGSKNIHMQNLFKEKFSLPIDLVDSFRIYKDPAPFLKRQLNDLKKVEEELSKIYL